MNGLGFTYSSGESEGSTRAGQPAFSLRGVNLAIPKGTVSVVIGPSGCGKTTLLRCMTGIIPSIIKGSLFGSVKLNGREIAGRGNGESGSSAIAGPNEISLTAGLVMQEPDHQIFMTTVEDDIAFGPENRMAAPGEIRAEVNACSRFVGLPSRLTDDPSTLSGGGKQRLAIAGILASAPDILLFDEPVGGLDDSGRAMFATLICELKEIGKTIVIVEHDYEEFSYADVWILMKHGEIISAAPPNETDRGLLEGELWR
jgi:energy-coupling factor transporter ATP-binding protein EcfA2